jgi:hypothetical protein
MDMVAVCNRHVAEVGRRACVWGVGWGLVRPRKKGVLCVHVVNAAQGKRSPLTAGTLLVDLSVQQHVPHVKCAHLSPSAAG